MIILILILLILFWFLGYVRVDGIPSLDIVLFSINGQVITLWNILILLLISWAIGILPSPFRQIAGVALVIWVLSILGIIAISGLSSILVVAVILGLLLFLIGGF